jgi:hypothetical protein
MTQRLRIPFLAKKLTVLDSLTVAGRAITGVVTGTVDVDPGQIVGGEWGTIAVTITGVKAGDLVVMEPPFNLDADLVYAGCRVTANTVTIVLNNIGATVNAGASTWTYKLIAS